MQTLLFEVNPRVGHEEHYLSHAEKLRPYLLKEEGLLFIERYRSLSRSGIILSHSLWQDEASIARWRSNKNHHSAQSAGRYKHFKNYRIRISHALQHCTGNGKQEHWGSDGIYSKALRSIDRYITIIRTKSLQQDFTVEAFESLTEQNSFLYVFEFEQQQAALQQYTEAQKHEYTIAATVAKVSRDYGMHNRAEAPQYFQAVEN